jgi:hypothetical protein
VDLLAVVLGGGVLASAGTLAAALVLNARADRRFSRSYRAASAERAAWRGSSVTGTPNDPILYNYFD